MTEQLALHTVETFRTRYREFPQAWNLLSNDIRDKWYSSSAWTQRFKCCSISCGAVQLPNGMELRYGNPHFVQTWNPDRYGKDKGGWMTDWKFMFNGREQKMYGAKFFENIDQALARIILSDAALRIAKRGLNFVLQLHDELVYIVPDSEVETARKQVHAELVVPPVWAPDLPLAAEIGIGQSYGQAKT